MIRFGTRQVGVVVAVFVFGMTTAQSQTNAVFIESKTVLPGQTGVTVMVYVSNAEGVTGLVFPFEFRTVGDATEPHAFTQGIITQDWNPLGRAYTSPLSPMRPHGPPGQTVSRRYPLSGGATCSGPISSTYQIADTTPDNSSPDGSLFTAVSTGDCCNTDFDLDPGTELPGIDIPSFLIQFNVNTVQGQFEIDTCCVRPNNHFLYVDRNTNLVVPTFAKGVITIDCDCSCLGDPNCDSETDVIDLVETINVAFRGMAGVTDSDCMLSRTDLNASGATDIVDVSLMVRAVFRGEPIGTIVSNRCN